MSSLDVFVHRRISAAEFIDTGLRSNDQSVRKDPDIGRSFSHTFVQNHIISSGPPAWFVVTVQGPISASSLAADALRNADRALQPFPPSCGSRLDQNPSEADARL